MLKTADDIFSRGWSKMKLYFMIGLPTEEDEDVVAIMETAKKARDVAFKNKVKYSTDCKTKMNVIFTLSSRASSRTETVSIKTC